MTTRKEHSTAKLAVLLEIQYSKNRLATYAKQWLHNGRVEPLLKAIVDLEKLEEKSRLTP
ncbi:MAG: hypothetical protein ACREBG_01850 [Pyrinomonadaceae bacterium]